MTLQYSCNSQQQIERMLVEPLMETTTEEQPKGIYRRLKAFMGTFAVQPRVKMSAS